MSQNLEDMPRYKIVLHTFYPYLQTLCNGVGSGRTTGSGGGARRQELRHQSSTDERKNVEE